ncbi:helix-turn-helix transcriptional regulator [Kribbella pittospori]|uniref:Helix-turn-helix transcriptional regulator n=1 Tax=Kribbella pittospori TaxID=722689 RepID=A0A4R0KR25_9ACTN|nr:LuxR family transcriptional regulator [Kribbella pittospori]TCC62909.1 helix-turn-helix transcriptional regulator [Kribbella pittospori]
MLFGREPERVRLQQLVAAVEDGHPGLLVVRGEAGSGKSTLLEHAASCCADDTLILRATGGESEAELPFAGLHQLLRPLLWRTGDLLQPQADALDSAFGTTPARHADRMLVGLAALTLLSEAADEHPVLCLVDDADKLDRPSVDALWFVAGRLLAERIGLLMAARDEFLSGAPELWLTGLDEEAATSLLRARNPELTDDMVARVIEETSANPLALREVPTALSAAQRAGVEPVVGPLPLTERLQDIFSARVSELPESTQKLLLLAAAEDSGELAVILRAARFGGIEATGLDAAEAAELVRIEDDVRGARVRFRHPLVRAAVYRSATQTARFAAHTALAEALDPALDPDRRAWQLAAAAPSPDDRIADELDRCAVRALQRGGPSTAATAYEKAAWLTESEAARAQRLASAAEAADSAGHPVQAVRLADQSDQLTTDLVVHARNRRLRANLAFDRGSPVTVHRLLMTDIAAVAAADPDLSARLLVDAVKNAWFANEREWSREAIAGLRTLRLPENSSQRSAARVVLELSDRLEVMTGGRPLGLPASYDVSLVDDRTPLELVLRGGADLSLADDSGALGRAETAVRVCRAGGQLALLVLSLQILATVETITGRYRFARANAREGLELATALGQDNRSCHFQALLAWLEAVAGNEESCRKLAAEALGHARLQRIAPVVALGRWALTLLDLGLGQPVQALEQATYGDVEESEHPVVAMRQSPDLIEAAARCGRAAEVRERLEQLASWAEDNGRPSALAVSLRCQALLADDETADDLYVRALELHDEAGRGGEVRPFDRARTQLLYGEWLRRQRRRTDASAPLRAAADTFDQLGAVPWSRRANGELRATGIGGRPSRSMPLETLTPQELQVARLAGEGASNREIGAQLFLSPRTVAYHLHKIFRKLHLRSRVELGQLAAEEFADGQR